MQPAFYAVLLADETESHLGTPLRLRRGRRLDAVV